MEAVDNRNQKSEKEKRNRSGAVAWPPHVHSRTPKTAKTSRVLDRETKPHRPGEQSARCLLLCLLLPSDLYRGDFSAVCFAFFLPFLDCGTESINSSLKQILNTFPWQSWAARGANRANAAERETRNRCHPPPK